MEATDLLQVCLSRKPTHVLYILWPCCALVIPYLYACVFTLINCRVRMWDLALRCVKYREHSGSSPSLHPNKRSHLNDISLATASASYLSCHTVRSIAQTPDRCFSGWWSPWNICARGSDFTTSLVGVRSERSHCPSISAMAFVTWGRGLALLQQSQWM